MAWFLSILVSDVRYGARMLTGARGFTATALCVIALGVAATTAVFSLVNAVLLRSMPYGDASRLVFLWTPNVRWKGTIIPQELSPNSPDVFDWQRLSHSFSSIAMLDQRMFNVITGHGVLRVGGALVSGNFFKTLQAWPELGRAIDAGDDRPGHNAVVVIGDSIWRSNYGADPHVLGKAIELNRRNYTVIGVMQKDFGFPFEGDLPYGMSNYTDTQLWIPVALSEKEKTDRVNFTTSDAVVARLRPGVSVRQSQQELVAIEARLNTLYPERWKGWTALVRPLVDTIVGPVKETLWLLLGAVALVLLIACSNVANLLLARVTARTREMGIRSALGAERARLIRQMTTESLLLSLAGGGLGALLAFAAVRGIVHINPGNIPRFDRTSVDGMVLLVTLAVSILIGVLSGIAPAFAGSRIDVNEALKEGGNRGAAGTRNGWRHALIVSEVALSVVLLAGAGLLIRSYLRVQAVDPGFSPSTLTMQLTLDDTYDTPQRRQIFFRRFLDRIRSLPGVLDAGATRTIPFDNSEEVAFVDIKGFGQPKEMVENRPVTPGYFDAMGMHLVAGRSFDEHDISSHNRVMIVNESFARTYLRGGDPLRRQIRLGVGDFSRVSWSNVIGIVGNLRHATLEENPQPQVFRPYEPGFESDARFAIRSSLPPERIISSVRAILHKMDPDLAMQDVRTMGQRIAQAEARRRFETVLMIAFAGLALVLALTGLYGLMSYAVRQRTAEIGLRMALGASRARVIALILGDGLRLVAIGLAVGIATGLVLTRLVNSWLYGVQATDPLTFVAVPLFLLVVACCACLIPALHATQVDPASTLRSP